jgi:hypothetical protein
MFRSFPHSLHAGTKIVLHNMALPLKQFPEYTAPSSCFTQRHTLALGLYCIMYIAHKMSWKTFKAEQWCIMIVGNIYILVYVEGSGRDLI